MPDLEMAGLDTGDTRELIDKTNLAVLDADVQIVRQSDVLQEDRPEQNATEAASFDHYR
jgi:hypothetical protein